MDYSGNIVTSNDLSSKKRAPTASKRVVNALFNDCYDPINCCQNEVILTENLDGLHKMNNYNLCKITFGKDEVAGSNPAISSIEKPVTAMVFGLFA